MMSRAADTRFEVTRDVFCRFASPSPGPSKERVPARACAMLLLALLTQNDSAPKRRSMESEFFFVVLEGPDDFRIWG